LKRAVIIVGSLLGTAGLLGIALYLGAFGFDVRRFGTHERRLERLVALKPQLDDVTLALRGEGSPLVASPAGEPDLRRAAARFRDQKLEEILRKGRAFPTTRVHLAADMVYFLYYDSDGILRDFTCVSR
jgi:hypothetical protein